MIDYYEKEQQMLRLCISSSPLAERSMTKLRKRMGVSELTFVIIRATLIERGWLKEERIGRCTIHRTTAGGKKSLKE